MKHGMAVIFWPVTPCNLGVMYSLHLQGKLTVVS